MQKLDKKYLERWANIYSLAMSIPNDSRFEMANWAVPDKTACGTAACMAGHAALHPWFRLRGLIPTFLYGEMQLDGIVQRVFGYELFGGHATPFSPWVCRDLMGLSDDDRITPRRGARAVKKYMLMFWPKTDVEAAIANAVATYDAEYVHKYAPWVNQ